MQNAVNYTIDLRVLVSIPLYCSLHFRFSDLLKFLSKHKKTIEAGLVEPHRGDSMPSRGLQDEDGMGGHPPGRAEGT